MQQAKVALVTGVGRREGIGFEICRQLGKKGFSVVLTARTAKQAKDLAQILAEEGLRVSGLQLDIAAEKSVAGAVSAVQEGFGHLDILVNNAAGAAHYGETVSDANLGDARKLFDTILFGNWSVIQAMLPLLRKSEHPRIVNVSSGAGSHGDPAFGLRTGNAMGPSYAVAKAALNALTALLAKELEKTNILVNATDPGLTATFPGAEKMGARPASDGAASIVWAALLPDDGPRGGFFRDGKELAW